HPIHPGQAMPPRKAVEYPALTEREHEVADGIVTGLSNKEIGTHLGISYETVKELVAKVLRKYKVPRRELVAIRVLREQLTADALGPEFMREFDRRTSELERIADDLLKRVSTLRAMVSAAVRKKAK